MTKTVKERESTDHPNITVRLLLDEPTDEDRFGSHAGVAESIAATVRTSTQGSALALVGSYGSGKSSIIQMMTKDLGDDATVVEFDAWGHRGDAIARAFLINAIDRVKEHLDEDDQKDLEGHQRKLKEPKSETRGRSTPKTIFNGLYSGELDERTVYRTNEASRGSAVVTEGGLFFPSTTVPSRAMLLNQVVCPNYGTRWRRAHP